MASQKRTREMHRCPCGAAHPLTPSDVRRHRAGASHQAWLRHEGGWGSHEHEQALNAMVDDRLYLPKAPKAPKVPKAPRAPNRGRGRRLHGPVAGPVIQVPRVAATRSPPTSGRGSDPDSGRGSDPDSNGDLILIDDNPLAAYGPHVA